MLDIINDPDIENNLGGWSFPTSQLQQEEWIKNLRTNEKNLRCMIATKEDSTVGTIILSDIDYKNGTAEIHIKLHNTLRKNGYGTEAINLMLHYAFNELRLNCIYAHINSYNENSQKAFEKCGFKKDGTLRAKIFKKGEYQDVYIYSLIKGDSYGNR